MTRSALCSAFPQTLPVLFGYVFMGMAFGILLEQAGYSFVWAFFISVFVYAGSMQFVLVDLLANSASLAACALMTLMINFRHVFYGLSLIERFGKCKPFSRLYLIHSLTDETYSLHCLPRTQDGISDQQNMLAVAVLDHLYWICGSVLGALVGTLLPFDTTGIDFAMTALFVVIFVEQWKQSQEHHPALIGLICAVVCLLLFGADRFLPPALLATVLALIILRRHMQPKQEEKTE